MSRSVLVTGITGTFGRAFLQHCVSTGGRWTRIVGYSRDEWKQSQITEEFGDKLPALRMFLGDVRDAERLGMAMRGIDDVIHAAALKRIDAGTYSPSEMIVTNVLGTMNVVNAAIKENASRVVVISSDKACAPTNLYGMTKGCAESYAVHSNTYGFPSGTYVAAVRYGNIIGSRGSVLHRWREQAAKGDPLTVTDDRMTRFVMTIEDAVELVEYGLTKMVGGEIFVPVLDTCTVVDLASASVDVDVPRPAVTFTGLRPGGEKLAESLLNDADEPVRTRRLSGKYLVVTPGHHEWTARDKWGGVGCEADARNYRSDNPGPLGNKRLTVDQLRALLAATGALKL